MLVACRLAGLSEHLLWPAPHFSPELGSVPFDGKWYGAILVTYPAEPHQSTAFCFRDEAVKAFDQLGLHTRCPRRYGLR